MKERQSGDRPAGPDRHEAVDRLIADAARSYHEPPATPRDEMWAAIQDARRSRTARAPATRRPGLRWLAWGAGIAAVLALGIGIGLTVAGDSGGPPAMAAGHAATSPDRGPKAAVNTALAIATTQHLAQAETFLTLFRDAVRSREAVAPASATARRLLTTNRLLTDSPAATDPALRDLLQDLELVLAQIARLSDESWDGETDLITDGIEQRDVLTRLQTVVPAGTSRVAHSL